jgi:hypothetical protein
MKIKLFKNLTKRGKWIFGIAGILIISAVVLSIYTTINTQSQLEILQSTNTPSSYTFNGYDYSTKVTKNANFAIYGVSIAGMTSEEASQIPYSDFSLVTTIASAQSFIPVANYRYYVKGYIAGFDDQWLVPVLGSNDVYFMNSTADVAMVATSLGGVTLNQTDYDKWEVTTYTLNDTESATAKVTSLEGFLPYYDFSTDTFNRTCIRVQFNDTAALNYCDLVGYSDSQENEKVSTVYTFYQLDTMLLGTQHFSLDFGTGLRSTFEVIGRKLHCMGHSVLDLLFFYFFLYFQF